MSSFYEDIEQMLSRMRALLQFFKADSPFGLSQLVLPSDLLSMRGEKFRTELSERLDSLTTSQISLNDLNDRDESGTEPSLGHQRRTIFKDVASVKNFYVMDLLPQVYKLYSFLQTNPDARTFMLDLARILPREESNTTATSAPLNDARDNRPTSGDKSSEVPQLRAASTFRKDNSDPRDGLKQAEQVLGDYVNWYILFKEDLGSKCFEIRSELEKNDGEAIVANKDYWNNIYHLLQKLQAKVDGQKPGVLKSMADFKSFKNALSKALQLSKTVPLNMPESEKLQKHSDVLEFVRTAYQHEETIVEICRIGAIKQLEAIHSSIETIFGTKPDEEPDLTAFPPTFTTSVIRKRPLPKTKDTNNGRRLRYGRAHPDS